MITHSTAMPAADQGAARQAAKWLARVKMAAKASPAEHERELAAAQRWAGQSPHNQRAWAAASQLLSDLETLPKGLALDHGERIAEVGATHRAQRQRERRALLGVVGGIGLTGTLAAQWQPWRSWAADQTTAVGQTRVIRLAEAGAELTLNTDTSVDVDAAARRARLYEGELLLSLPAPAAAAAAPPSWQLRAGATMVQAQGRKLSLSRWGGVWRVAALEGPLHLRPLAGERGPESLPGQLAQGQALQWADKGAVAKGPASPNDELWAQGLLLADGMPLGELVSRFNRHHRAVLRCDPAVAQRAVFGVYQLDDLHRMLQFVAANYPVRIRRFTDYWVTIEQA